MSVLSGVRTRLLVCCVAATAALGALALAPTAGAAKVGSTYLALGDSLAYGYHQAQFQKEFPAVNPANFNDGYVDVFGRLLSVANPALQTVNDGCPGETTETFIKGPSPYPISLYCAGGPTGGPFPKVFLHHPFAGTQLADAEAILTANPNVSPITLDIGANDVLQFIRSTCGFPAKYTCTEAQVAAEFKHIAENVGFILGHLRALAPKASIVFVSQYNPFPLVLKPEGTGDKSVEALNGALKGVAAAFGASFANNTQTFNYSGTHGGKESGDIPTICAFTAMCPGGVYNPASPEADIHPTKLGYAVMGLVTWITFATH
jgi:lysophospholipase L1-like esterase